MSETKVTNKVKITREKIKMTQEHLAELVGVSRQTIIKIESGKTKRTEDIIMLRIASALNVSVNDIFFTPLVKHVFQSKTNDTN